MKTPTAEQLLAENAELRVRLDEAEQTLSAIRCGEVDAVVVTGPKGEQIFSLVGAESIYRLIVETMKEAAFTVTFDGTILFCNAQFGEFVQRPMEQIVGHWLHEFVAPDNVAAADSLLILSGKQPVKQRLVLWNSQEQRVPVHISANVLDQPGGPSICIVASDLTELENSTDLIQQLRRQQEALRDSRIAALNLMQDAVETRRQVEQANENLHLEIAERQRAEEALRESEFHLARAQEMAHLGSWAWDIGADRLFWSDETYRLIGLPPGELLPRNEEFLGFVHPEDRPRVEQAIQEALAHQPYNLDFRIVRQGGEQRYVHSEGQVTFDKEDNPVKMEGTVQDITERRRAEEALAASERNYRQLIETANSVIIRWDNQGIIRFINDYGLRFFGYAAEELLDRDVMTIVPKVEASTGRDLDALVKDIVVHPEPYTYVPSENLRKDGATAWVAWTNKAILDEQGNVREILAIGNDITELKQAEEELRESEERFRLMVESAQDYAIFMLDPAGRIATWNIGAQRLKGYSAEEIIGKHFACFYPPEDPDKPQRELAIAAKAGQYSEEGWRLRKDGSRFWASVTITALHEKNGALRGFAKIERDVSERKRAEEALRETRDYLDNLFNYANAPIIVWDPQFKITRFNAAFEHLTGRQAQEVLGREIDVLFPPDSREESLAHIRRTTSQKERWEVIEIRILHTSGDVRTVLWNSANVLASDNETVIATIAQGQDITERKRAEEALRELNTTLESKVAQRTAELRHRAGQLQKMTLEVSLAEDRERKRMAEILHDDLQQQLAAVKFHVSLLRNRTKNDPSLQQATVAEIDHMLKEAIEKSRSLSHELSPAVMHHGDFAATLRWLAGQVQAKHGLVVQVQAQGEVRSRSEALNSFLYKTAQEFLFNVIKHARVKEARLRVRRFGRYIYLSVSDRGCGFDPQGLREAAGFGLLNIRERIELLGGCMKIKSAPDQGSTFSIVVPDGTGSQDSVGVGPRAYPPSTVPGGRGEEEGGHGGPPLRVLLADDHEIVRQGLRSLLRDEHDVEVVGEAANGREAVDLANRLQPDVVIMDVSMPLIEGHEATRQIKAYLPQTRVIALSMCDQSEKREAMYRAGAESYVLKTAPSAELLAAIRGKKSSL